MKKLKWGVIGAGGIADRRTMPGMMLAENASLTALMTPRQEKAQELGKKYGVSRIYISEEELLRDPEVEAVYIASPVEAHKRQAMMAADYGKHVLLEKPLAMNVAEARELIRHCHDKNVQIGAGFMMRFGACAQKMRRELLNGTIGTPVSAYTQFTCWYPDTCGNWRLTKEKSGGGTLMDLGVHCLDLLQFVTGSKVVKVTALSETLTFSYEVEDSSSALLKLDNGMQAVLQANFNVPNEAAGCRLELFGTGGRILGEDIIGQEDAGTVEIIGAGSVSGPVKQLYTAAELKSGNLYTKEIESFSDSILNNKPLEVPAEDALYVQKIVEAAYLTAKTGKTMELS